MGYCMRPTLYLSSFKKRGGEIILDRHLTYPKDIPCNYAVTIRRIPYNLMSLKGSWLFQKLHMKIKVDTQLIT